MLILVRHGRTSANAGGLLQGRVDHELDDVGVQQANQIALALSQSESVPQAVVSSPLKRAVQTATATARLLGLEVTVDERWAELDYGEWDGTPIANVRSEQWRAWRTSQQFAPPKGESLAALNARVASACEDLMAEMSQRNVAVFTHVSPIKSAARWALGATEEISWRMHVAQAQITQIGVRGDVPVLHLFNDTSHLRL